jgi:putative heme-binding domain-containing protein
VLDIMLAVPGEQTALLRLALFEKLDVPAADLAKQLPSLARNVPVDRLEAIAALAHRKLSGDVTAQAALVASILNALDQRGAKPGRQLTEWAAALAPKLIGTNASASAWTNSGAGKSPWTIQTRKCADGEDAVVLSSFPRGEQLTGMLRSASFALPEKLRFYVCGHDGSPDKPPGKKNFIRLVDAANGKVLRETVPPRNDTAQRIEWDLAEFKGRRGYFEATDGDAGTAYAWIAFGRFKPELPELAVVEPGGPDMRRMLGVELIHRFRMAEFAPNIAAILTDAACDAETRASAAGTLLKIAPDDGIAKITAVLRDAPAALQTALARALAGNREGAAALLAAMAEGRASIALLRDQALIGALKATKLPGAEAEIAKYVAKLPPANAEADKLIATRRSAFDPSTASVTKGAQFFQTQCAICHRIGTVGNLVGPQLDGIGNRGADRIIEDILDPNRNVDRAFRLSIVTLKDNSVVSGLVRREEGAQLVLADFTGKEITVPLAQIAKREESDTSLMPPAFGQVIPPADFNDLLAYLVSQRATK